jgi:hypothetical protein
MMLFTVQLAKRKVKQNRHKPARPIEQRFVYIHPKDFYSETGGLPVAI